MEKWFVLAPEMLLDLHPGLSYLREVSIVRLHTLKENTYCCQSVAYQNSKFKLVRRENFLKILMISDRCVGG